MAFPYIGTEPTEIKRPDFLVLRRRDDFTDPILKVRDEKSWLLTLD